MFIDAVRFFSVGEGGCPYNKFTNNNKTEGAIAISKKINVMRFLHIYI